MSIIERDLKHIWHPCAQMKDYETFQPLEVTGAQGSYIHLANGQKLIDSISNWWSKNLGHNHPRLKAALQKQSEQFEHVLLANTTNQVVVELSEKLASLSPSLSKAMYASDGSCAVEIAMKMSLHSRQLQNQNQRSLFMGLSHAYHGETLFALSVSDCDIYKAPYKNVLPETALLSQLPYVSGQDDPLWEDCSSIWPDILSQLEAVQDKLTAIIVEPILQGGGGMKIYSKDFLIRLREWTKAQGIHLIADEIMSGFGRTGTALACQHAGIEPDFLVLSKGLNAGYLPLSVCLTSDAIYDLFYDDYATGKSFLHSHTHTGNALAAAVTLEALRVIDDENIYQQVQANSQYLKESMQAIAERTGKLKNLRHIGYMVAADLITEHERGGYEVYQQAVKLGALLRPLGNTVYWTPPLNIQGQTLDDLAAITEQALLQTQGI